MNNSSENVLVPIFIANENEFFSYNGKRNKKNEVVKLKTKVNLSKIKNQLFLKFTLLRVFLDHSESDLD